MPSSILKNPLGYFFNQGGLNNQKLALLGLFLKASQEGSRPIVLPNLLLFDQITFNHVPVPLDSALQIAPLREFAARHGIEILDVSPQGDRGAWDYFHLGNNYIPRAALLNELTAEGFTCDFLRSLVPISQSSALLQRVAEATYREKGIRLAAQLRIERDWPQHTAERLKPVVGDAEDNAPSFSDIIAKICKTLPDNAFQIYVVCDEAALPVPKDEIRNEIKQKFGIDLFWKSDFLTNDELAGLSLLELSMLDFEMSVDAELFVGLSRSTFSNMVALEKYARTRMPVEGHYIYNIVGPQLAPRKDNGAFSASGLAIAADPWNPAYDFQVAQIFQASGDQERALEHYSAHAASAGVSPEDKYLSLYRAAQVKADLSFSAPEVIDTYLRAAEALPSRAEARHGASRHARFNNMFKEGYEIAKPAINLATPAGGRFVEPWIYEWALLDEYAVNAYWIRHYRESLDASLQALSRQTLPGDHRNRIASNARNALEGFLRQSDTGLDIAAPANDRPDTGTPAPAAETGLGHGENILLRRAMALGDVLETTPIARRIRLTFPSATIYLETQHGHAYTDNPDVDYVGVPPGTQFSRVIDLDLAYERNCSIHQVDAYMEAAFGDRGEGHDKTIVFRHASNPITGVDFSRVVAIHPNVSWRNRTLPREWWGDLARRLIADGWTVLALGTHIDHDLSEFGVVDTRDQLTLAQQAGVIADSRVLVCGDSSMFTLVGCTDTPAVGFCTITRAERFMPYRHGELGWNFTAVAADVPCYGCREEAGPAWLCRHEHFNCVRSFALDKAFNAILDAMKNDRRNETAIPMEGVQAGGSPKAIEAPPVDYQLMMQKQAELAQYKDLDPNFIKIYDQVRQYSMTSIERLHAMYRATEYVSRNNIRGSIVECGVWRGGSIMIALMTLMSLADTSREIYLFDTFEGLPRPDPDIDLDADGISQFAEWVRHRRTDRSSDWAYASLEEVERNVTATGYPREKLRFIKGMVQDTLRFHTPDQISLLRLDTDWYESTMCELNTLYPHLQPGGVLIVDDYGHLLGQRRAVDEFFATQAAPMLLNRVDYSGRVGLKLGLPLI